MKKLLLLNVCAIVCLALGSGVTGNKLFAQSPDTSSPTQSVAIAAGVVSPTNAFADDETYAEFNAINVEEYYFDFGFSIPSNATINGIELKLTGYSVGQIELSADIGTDSSTLSSDAKVVFEEIPGDISTGTFTFGSATELWGFASLDPSDINSTDFGVSLKVTSIIISSVFIDYIEIVVYYCVPPTTLVVQNLDWNTSSTAAYNCSAIGNLNDAITSGPDGDPTGTLQFSLNSDYSTVIGTPSNYTITSTGPTTIYVRAQNSCGTVNRSFTVTVADDQDPNVTTLPEDLNLTGCATSVITVPAYNESLTTSDYATFSGAPNNGVAEDNCTDASSLIVRYQDVATGTCTITVVRTWELEDAASNVTTVSQTITITAPDVVLVAPADVTITQCTDQAAVNTAFDAWIAGFTEAGGCDLVVSPTLTELQALTAPNFCGGSVTVERTGTSSCEDPVVVSSTFTVEPDLAPTFFAREDPSDNRIPWLTPAITKDRETSNCAISVNWPTPYIEDDCPDLQVPTRTITPAVDPALIIRDFYRTSATLNPGTYTVTYSYTDVCSNSISRTFTITVSDPFAPTFSSVTTSKNINTETGLCTGKVDNWLVPNPQHDCGATMVTVIDLVDGTRIVDATNNNSYDGFQVGVNSVSFVATSNISGNVATQTFTVTVTDNQAPTFTCPVVAGPYNDSTDTGECYADLSFTITDLFDNCGVQSISFTVTHDGVPEVFDGDGTFLTLNHEFKVGTSTVDVLVTDVNGLTESCSFDVVVTDNQNPDVTLTPITRSLDVDGEYTLTQADVDAIIDADDNCGVVSPTTASIQPNTFDCDDTGPNTVTVTVADVNGNQVVLTTTITIEDTTPPSLTCPTVAASYNTDPGACTVSLTFTATATDNCDDGDVVITYYIGGSGGTPISFPYEFPVGTTTVTVVAKDASDNEDECEFVVIVEDNQDPVFDTFPTPVATYPTDTDECFASLDFSGDVTASSNCEPVDIQFFDNGTEITVWPYEFPVGTTTVTVIATDNSGRTVSDTFTVNVEDTQPPAIHNCPPNPAIVVTATGTNCTKVVEWPAVTATDNCTDPVTLWAEFSHDPTANFLTTTSGGVDLHWRELPVGITTVTYYAQDAAGLISSCTFTINVLHATAPVAKAVATYDAILDTNGNTEVTITPEDIDDGTNILGEVYSCTFESWSVSPNHFTCDDIGDHTVTLTVRDKSGRVSTATTLVTVKDTQPPVVTAQDITVYLVGTTVSIDPDDIIDNIVENCGIKTKTLSQYDFTCADAGQTISVTITVEDLDGNIGTAVANVTVEDNTPPTLVADDITVQLDASGQFTITAMDVYNEAASEDNCGIDTNTFTLSRSSFNCSDIGIPVIVTFEGADIHGNLASDTFTVTVEDNIAPDIFCIGNQTATTTVDCTYVHSGTAWDATVTDNCTVSSPTFTFTGVTATPSGTNVTLDGVVFELGVTTVIWEFTDMGGNTVSCTFDVVVVDDLPPVLVCPAPIEVNLGDTDVCSESVSWPAPIPTDNCGLVTLDWPPVSNRVNSPNNWEVFTNGGIDNHRGVNFLAGITTITYRAEDAAGNETTCSFTVTLHAFADPEAITQNITVYLDSNGEFSIQPIDVNNNSSIGCQGSADIADFLSLDIDTFDCDDVGDNTVTLTVTDKSGRTDSATAIVTVVDNIPPTVITQPLTVPLDINGQASITPQQVDNSSFDNCGIVTSTMTLDQSDFDCGDIGDVIVELTVWDVNGLSATATATITVVDNLAPVITCAAAIGSAITVGTATDSCTYTHEGTEWDATAQDNCGSYTLTYTLDGPITTVDMPLH